MRPILAASLVALTSCGQIIGSSSAGMTPKAAQNLGSPSRLGTVFAVSTSGKERVIYRFTNTLGDRGDGENPYAGLTNLNGALYGTTILGTHAGGTYNGTAFRVDPNGSERVLHIFGMGTDGIWPYAGLTPLNGMLYGTTLDGGASNGGTAFELNPATGKERILYNFPSYTNPEAGLTVVNGALYGTTSGGGTGCGTVFSLTIAGKLRTLYEFTCKSNGAFPHAGLLALNGVLYGTTTQGGTSGPGAGTIFAVSLSGKENTLHLFAGYPSDGAYPFGTLIAINGLLYGTTLGGGSSTACIAPEGGYGCGTIYTVTPSGTVNILYSFAGGSDGEFPYAGLTLFKKNLYGTTAFGGGTTCSYYGTGCGTIFMASTSGEEKVLYRFEGGTDGANPYGTLTALNGMLYGTTYFGGAEK